MKNLVKAVMNDDAFDANKGLDTDLINQYFIVNERKKKDEAWLKENSLKIKSMLQSLGKSTVMVDDIKVSVSASNTSKFDMDKVLEFLTSKNLLQYTKQVVDEKALMEAIDNGEIDIEELKEYAWVESTGSPKLTVKRVKKEDD